MVFKILGFDKTAGEPRRDTDVPFFQYRILKTGHFRRPRTQ